MTLTSEKRRALMLFSVCALAGLTLLFVFGGSATAFAAPATTPATIVGAIVTVIGKIVKAVGVIFVLVGLVKLVMAYANESGPDQQKAALMLATGIVLFILPTVLESLNLGTWLADLT